MSRRVILEYRGDALELPLGITVVGRDLECRLRIHDEAVSRRHLRFIHRTDELFVEDLSSTNGTLLNGRPLFQPVRIHDGDLLSLGNREIRVAFLGDDELDDIEAKTLVVGPPSQPDPAPATTQIRAMAVPSHSRPKTTSRIKWDAPQAAPAEQRCPRCSAVVQMTDDQCESCGYRWADFHPRRTTQVGLNPLRERRHSRHEITLPLIYRSETLELEAQTKDLSLSGVFVCSKILDTEGTDCSLLILIDGGPPIEITGRVTRVVPSSIEGEAGFGVEFGALGQLSQQWLAAQIRRFESAS